MVDTALPEDTERRRPVVAKPPSVAPPVAAAPAASPAAPAAAAAPAAPSGSGFFPPAQPGPQSWRDWVTKTYSPSASDFAKIYGDAASYHLAPAVAQGANAVAGAANRPTPFGAGTAELLRSGAEAARERAGPMTPFVSALGYATSPLTYLGVGPASRAIGAGVEGIAPEASALAAKYLPAAARFVPRNLFPKMAEGATTSGMTSAAYGAGEGQSPKDIALNAAVNMPVGALLGALASGRRTPADVTQSTAALAKSADEAAKAIPVSSKDLGFVVEGKRNPTVGDLMKTRDWLNSVPPAHDEAGAAPRMLKSIDKAMAQPEVQQAFDASTQADKQAQWAQQLERMHGNVGLPGAVGDVRPQTADLSQQFPPGSPQNAALQAIARVPDPKERVVSPWARSAMIGVGGAGGEGVGYLTGIPGLGAGGAQVGNAAANAIDWAANPGGPGPAIRRQITQAYPAFTGQTLGTNPNAQNVSNALLRLYGAGSQSQ